MDTSLRSQLNTGLPSGVAASPSGKLVPQNGKQLPSLPNTALTNTQAPPPRPLDIESSRPMEVPTAVETREAIQRLNEVLQERSRELEFTVDEGSGKTIVKVIHSESGEVIRQLPPEVVLRFASAFTEGSASLLEEFA